MTVNGRKRWKGRHRLVSSKDAKLVLLISVWIMIAFSLISIVVAGIIRRGNDWRDSVWGEAKDPEAAFLSFFIAFAVPAILVWSIALRPKDWREITADRIYVWQARAIIWGSSILCLLIVIFMGYATFFAYYQREVRITDTTSTFEPLLNWQLLSLVQDICTYASWAISLLLGWGFFEKTVNVPSVVKDTTDEELFEDK